MFDRCATYTINNTIFDNVIVIVIIIIIIVFIASFQTYGGVQYNCNSYTGMDITCLHTSSWEFICDSLRLSHITSDVIMYHCCAA